MLIFWLVPFIFATVVLMILSGIFDSWDLSPVRSIIIAFFATLLPLILSTFLAFTLPISLGLSLYFFWIFLFGNTIFGLIFWIILVMLISDADWEDKLKIAVLGFAVTQIILFIFYFIFGFI